MENLQLKESLFTNKSNQSYGSKTPAWGKDDSNGNSLSYKDLLQEFKNQQNSSTQQEQQKNNQSANQQSTLASQKSAQEMLGALSMFSNARNIASQVNLGASNAQTSQNSNAMSASITITDAPSGMSQIRTAIGSSTNTSQKSLLGDLNSDGNIDADDLDLLEEYTIKQLYNKNADAAEKFAKDKNINLTAIDADGNGTIDKSDISATSKAISDYLRKANSKTTIENTPSNIPNPSLKSSDSSNFSYNNSDLNSELDSVKNHIVGLNKIIDKETIDKFDFDGDGKIGVSDLSSLSDMLNFDINGDGLFDNSDAQAIRDFLNGKNTLPDKAVQRIEGIYEEKLDALKDIMLDIVNNFAKKEAASVSKNLTNDEKQTQKTPKERIQEIIDKIDNDAPNLPTEPLKNPSGYYKNDNDVLFFDGEMIATTYKYEYNIKLINGDFLLKKVQEKNSRWIQHKYYHIKHNDSSDIQLESSAYISRVTNKYWTGETKSCETSIHAVDDESLKIVVFENVHPLTIYGSSHETSYDSIELHSGKTTVYTGSSGSDINLSWNSYGNTIYATQGRNYIKFSYNSKYNNVVSGSTDGNTFTFDISEYTNISNNTIENLTKNDIIELSGYNFKEMPKATKNQKGDITLLNGMVTLKGNTSGDAKITYRDAKGNLQTTTINELLGIPIPIQPKPIVFPVNPTPPPTPNPKNVVALKNGDTFEITGKVTLHIDDHDNVDQATFKSKNDTLIYHATTDNPITIFAPKGEEKVDYADVQGSAKITLDNDGHINISSIDAPIKVYTFEDNVSVSALTGDNYISLSGKNGEVHIGNGNDVIEIRAEGANISSDGGNNVYKFLPFGKNATINNFNSDKDKLEFSNSLGKLKVELDFMDTVIKSKDGTVIARLANLSDRDSFSKIQKMIEEHNNSLLVDEQQGIKITPGKKIEGYVGETGGVVISDLVTSNPNNGMINVSMNVHNMKSTNAMVTIYNSDGTVYKTYPVEKFQRLPSDVVEVGEKIGNWLQDLCKDIRQKINGEKNVEWDNKTSATHTSLTFDMPVGGRIEITTNSVQNSELAIYNAVDTTVDLICSLMNIVCSADVKAPIRNQILQTITPQESEALQKLYKGFVETSIEKGRDLIFKDLVNLGCNVQKVLHNFDIGNTILNNVEDLSKSAMDAAASVALSLAPGGGRSSSCL